RLHWGIRWAGARGEADPRRSESSAELRGRLGTRGEKAGTRMLSHYKESLHGVADPVARLLLRAHLRPNQLTVAGLGVSIVAAHAFSQGRFRLAAGLLTVAGLLDFFDGSLARLARSESSFGAFLD